MELTISMVSTSAVAPETDYSWNTYNSAASFGLLFRGKEVLIANGTQFGLRDGSKGSARLILRGEPTKVMTITPEERTVLLARATPVTTKGGKQAKVQGVVPKFDAAAFWKNSIAPALKEAAAEVGKTTTPAPAVINYLKGVASMINSFSEAKGATRSGAANLLQFIPDAPSATLALKGDSENVKLAAQLLESSPEWKRIRTGKLKLSKYENAYSVGQDFYYAYIHMRLAKELASGFARNVRNVLSGLDTSARDSIPAKLYDKISDWAANAKAR